MLDVGTFRRRLEANYQELIQYVRKHNRIPPASHPTLKRRVENQRIGYRAWQAHLKADTEKSKCDTSKMDGAC